MGFQVNPTVVATLKDGAVDGPGLLVAARMNASLAGLGGTRDGTERSSHSKLGGLDSQRLAHDGAAVAEQLQLGHGAATGRHLRTGCRRQRTQRRGRGLLQERAHCLGLAKDTIHDGSMAIVKNHNGGGGSKWR